MHKQYETLDIQKLCLEGKHTLTSKKTEAGWIYVCIHCGTEYSGNVTTSWQPHSQ